MNFEDYPAQEPFTNIGSLYHQEMIQRASRVADFEVQHGDNPYQSLAVYRSDKPNGSVLCVMHGGGWTNGYKEWMAFMADALTTRGVTMVSLGYRLAPSHLFPAGLEDCFDGVAWVWRTISEHGGDPAKVFVSGHSAGGHHAALMTLRQDWQAQRDLPRDVIRGALPISGTYLFGEDSGLSMRPRFLGPTGQGNAQAASPQHHIRAEAPPFFVAWGEKDFPHLIQQSLDFAQTLRESGNVVETITLAGCDHLGASYASGDIGGEWIKQAAAFIENH